MSEGERAFGGQTLVEPLRRVLVRSPSTVNLGRWREYGWLGEPDPLVAAKQHDAFCELLRDAGAEVLLSESDVGGDPDAIYTCDPAFMSDRGAIVLRPGKVARQVESRAILEDLQTHGIPIWREMPEPATAEGGDII
ncbi:MAG: hypothetical protein ACXWDA_07050, partial [Aeromicrobium sp.]